MAPLEEWEEDEHEREPPPWITQDEDDHSTSVSPDIVLSIVSQSIPYTVMESITPTDSVSGPGFTGDVVPTARPSLPSTRPDWWPLNRPYPPYTFATSTTESWQTSTSATTPYADHWGSSSLGTTSASTSKLDPDAPLSPTSPYGDGPSDWNFSRKDANNAPIYAAAVVVPIVVLAIIGGVTLVCLRKRRRRKAEAIATHSVSQEMKMQPPKPGVQSQPNVQPYMAQPRPPPPSTQLPAISVSRQYNNIHTSSDSSNLPPTSTSSAFQPIILGPIVSDSNRAYLTGMDTSDMVSVSSNTLSNTLRPMDPFTDNNSLTGPPPPYRPHSVAPPSFTTNSRHSSLRDGSLRDGSLRDGSLRDGSLRDGSLRDGSLRDGSLREEEGVLGSRTRLIGSDPFGDPGDGDEDDEAVSELSGSTLEREGTSVVSDVSYQREAFGRS